MRLVASSTPIAMKHRALNQSTKLKNSPYNTVIINFLFTLSDCHNWANNFCFCNTCLPFYSPTLPLNWRCTNTWSHVAFKVRERRLSILHPEILLTDLYEWSGVWDMSGACDWYVTFILRSIILHFTMYLIYITKKCKILIFFTFWESIL